MFLKTINRLSINDLRPTQKGHSINATERFDSRGASSAVLAVAAVPLWADL